MVPVDEDDRERPDSPTPGDEAVTPGDEEVDELDRGAHLDAPPRRVGPDGDPATAWEDRGRSEQHNWRRWAWWALIIATVGGGWVLVLATIFVVRSGDRTAELISLFEEGQQQRQAASGGVQQSQEERQAALKTQQQQSQTFRAQELAALAEQAQSNAEARRALADAALAASRVDQADSEVASGGRRGGACPSSNRSSSQKGEPATGGSACRRLRPAASGRRTGDARRSHRGTASRDQTGWKRRAGALSGSGRPCEAARTQRFLHHRQC